MAQIKQTVELLTKILYENGTSKIKAEVFRKAKFNQNEATGSMWKLLFELLYLLNYKTIDDATLKTYSLLTKEEIVVYVKTEMKLRGFVLRHFHELSSEMESGSRELLLAFGWLLCKFNLMNVFMNKCCSSLELTATNSPLEIPEACNEPSLPNNAEQKVKYLMWLNGKLRMSLRNLHALQQHKNKLRQTIELYTRGVSTDPTQRDHLTVLEVMMLKNPELLKKNLQLLDADNSRMESLLEWSKHDEVFWQWMESVLDAKLAGSEMTRDVSEDITPRSKAIKNRVEGKLELTEAISLYESIVSQLEHNLRTQGSKSMLDQDLDELLASINAEISLHQNNLMINANPIAEARPVVAPPVARIRPVLRDVSVTTSVSGAEDEIDKMEVELNQLQVLVERLQHNIEFKQKSYKDEISSLSSGYDDVVAGPTLFKSFR